MFSPFEKLNQATTPLLHEEKKPLIYTQIYSKEEIKNFVGLGETLKGIRLRLNKDCISIENERKKLLEKRAKI
jgi:hypothetical protein